MSHRPRKRFGQNFLTDRGVIDRIVDAIDPRPGQRIVEIGPGQAALSTELAASGADLLLLEIDRDLAATLARRFGATPNVELVTADALDTDFGALADEGPIRLVGNLPYNISTPLLFHVLRWSGRIVDMHFMLQREVVDRMAAQPGSKRRGRLSLSCQLHCAVHPLFTVPPEAFSPRPRVESAVVRLLPHAHPPVQLDDPNGFERVVAQAFSMRRKTLRNSLRGLADPAQLEGAGIDPGLRPEALTLEQFAAIANRIAADR